MAKKEKGKKEEINIIKETPETEAKSDIDIDIPKESGEGFPGEEPELLIPEYNEDTPASDNPKGKEQKKDKKASSKEKDNSELVIEDIIMVEEAGEAGPTKSSVSSFTPDKHHRAKKLFGSHRHAYAAPLGFACILLAIIGLISVVIFSIKLTASIVDNTDEKNAFGWRVYPVLMFDPPAFDNPTQLDEVFTLKTALWKTILENRTKYSYNDMGMMVVPVSDLDVAAKSLYGGEVKLNHQTINEGYEYFYIYDENQKTYMVPTQGQTARYSPKVVKISKADNIYTLLVGYVPPNDLWNIDTEGNMSEPAPTKYMYYDLLKVQSGGYNLLSVRQVPKEELPADIELSTGQMNQTRYDEYVEDYLSQMTGASPEEPIPANAEPAEGEDAPLDDTGESEPTPEEENEG